jgi:hypothetical protein
MPFTVVIDKEGNIRSTVEGILYEDEFEKDVVPLVAGGGTKQTERPKGPPPSASE